MKIKKGDTVLIISGKDKGRKSKVLEVFSKEGKISVEGVNLIKKHQKPKKSGEKGQVIQLPKPINISEHVCESRKITDQTLSNLSIIKKLE